MHVITRGCVLFLWMHTLTFVKSQDCTLESFIKGPLYDSNFDITDLEASYPGGKQVRVSCNVGYSGFFKLICSQGNWLSKGNKCQPRSCGHPGDAQFADFHLDKGDDFVFGSQVVYTCHKGYQMVSRTNYRRCMAQGWDGVVPVCEAKQCPVIHVDNNVQVFGDLEEATNGNVVRFSCRSNSEILTGSSEIYCDEHGEWSSLPPKCEAIKCTVPVISNGYVPGDVQEYKEHEVLHFECNRQYKRTEGRPSKCIKLGSGAEWSPTPVCEPIKCTLALPPLEGTRYDPAFRNVFLPGDTLTVTCGQKYWIANHQDTSAVTTCTEAGEWTVRPICQEVICSNRRDPDVTWWDVYWGQRITLGETARYRCRSGYKSTDGTDLAKCNRDGWRPNPLCQEITCNRQDIENADILNPNKQIYRHKEKAKYVCKKGYRGNPTRTCEKSGWTGNSQCTEKSCDVSHIKDAQILHNEKRSYRPGEQVQYQCEDGKGPFTVTCKQGEWIGIQDCRGCPKPAVPNGFVVSYNGTVYYTCDEDYKPFSKGWWGEAKCIKGLWSGLGRCIEKRDCGEIPAIPNRKMTPQQQHVYSHGRSVQIECKKGYRAQVDRLTCQGGQWSSDGLPLKTICAPVASPCNPPPEVANAVVLTPYQREYLSNSEVTYQCRDQYTMDGEASIRCEDGEWEKNNINCTQYCFIRKDTRLAMTLTLDKERYTNEEEIQYQCITTDANGAARCVNGTWNNPVECEEKCKVTGVPDSVRIETHVPDNLLTKGQKLRFLCHQAGHFLHGNTEVECLANGQWSYPFPTCGPAVVCGKPPPLADGDTTESVQLQYRPYERVKYMCQNYYTMEGDPYKTCINGEWTGQMRCLKPCTVDKELMSQRNIAFKYTHDEKLYSTHDDQIEFICTRGRPVSRRSMRQTCVDGVMDLPTCQ